MVKIILAGMILLIGHGTVKEPPKSTPFPLPPEIIEPLKIIETFMVVAEGDISEIWKENISIFLEVLLSFQNKKNILKERYMIYFFPANKDANEELKNRVRETAPLWDINPELKKEMIKKIEENGSMKGIIWQKGSDAQITFTIAPWPPTLFGQAAEILYFKLIEMEKRGE